ncbi:TetR/AcrR family transcriptional regulator [Sphingobacterium siyangense]|uniref:TetR family transcriptional regulator n=1 Tax=Sphingobacterium siyangense TaxID=459529 RepID=A0A562MGX0_9SPHI|nr:TetR/AcrR family transcriptional regulator [Sphingobacterium siyangense]TWI19144.1 TetR family transcriptional regulator [Sphingobacterium siyangense]
MNTKERILIIAEQLFFLKGYHLTTMRDITQGAQLSLGMVNFHFNTKENLLNEILLRLDASIDRMINNYSTIHPEIENLKTFVNDTLNIFLDNPKTIFLFIREQLNPVSLEMRALVRSIQQKHMQAFFKLTQSLNMNFSKNPSLEDGITLFYYNIFGTLKEIAIEQQFEHATVLDGKSQKVIDFKNLVPSIVDSFLTDK